MSVTLWHDGAHDAPENMARDAALLERSAAGALPGTVLRLFTFVPAGITLGRAQVPERELDLAALARDGVRWARRPTGGRAIWHEDEWTFSLVTPLTAEGWARTAAEAYARTGELLARAFHAMGVPATLAPGSPRGVGPPRARDGAAPPCFASTARHELLLAGGKLAGIAQRSLGGTLLQQGSLLLGDAHTRLADYVALSAVSREALPAAAREALRAELRRSAATAGQALGAERGLGRLSEALAGLLPGASVLRGEEGSRALLAEPLPRRSD